jgi:hypothetical protein
VTGVGFPFPLTSTSEMPYSAVTASSSGVAIGYGTGRHLGGQVDRDDIGALLARPEIAPRQSLLIPVMRGSPSSP